MPKGSLWDESLQLHVRQEWRRISGGTVQVTIYSGGVLGDEPEMVRQIRQGRIQAVGLSSVGLSRDRQRGVVPPGADDVPLV